MRPRLRARLAPLAACVTLLGAALATPAVAQRSDVPTDQPLASAKSWAGGGGGFEELALGFALHEDLPPGTTVDLYLHGCRDGRAAEVFTRNTNNPDGAFYPFTYAAGVAQADGLMGRWWLSHSHYDAYLGPDWTGVLSISRPGLEPWVWNFSHDDFDFPGGDALPSNDDTCPPERTPITVQTWSAKKGTSTARVGKRLTVTRTRAGDATVSYVWVVGRGLAVDRDRSMVVKKSYRGKKVTMKIAVSKPGLRPVIKKIRYGIAR